MNKIDVILNGKPVVGYNGETILHLARRHGYKVPTLCHDSRLEPFSSCFVCVVHVENMRGMQPSCSTTINKGMVIDTEGEAVKRARKTALDLLLSNHYADCVAPCKTECPAGVDVQGYISLIEKGLYSEAVKLIKQTNPLPAICGRVCVRPCELVCRRNLVEEVGVGIDYLKRYASDKDLESKNPCSPGIEAPTGKSVAIIGAGPGGLTAAYYLAIKGHKAEIFEANKHAGGMLRYGIPPYRLPSDIIDKEVEAITQLGVKIHYNKKLGENLSYKDLEDSYDSVILAIGSQKGTGIGCENEDAGNVLSGLEFLRNIEILQQPYDFSGKKVAVIGGGNTAMDCCRTAMRFNADEVVVLYRRTEKEMPANPIEIHEAKLEGIKFKFLTAPAKVNTDKNGNVKSLTCFQMKLGEPDESGRRRPIKIDGSEFDVELDYILAAIGQKTVVNFIDDINKYAGSELKLNKWGDIDADPDTLQTSIQSVFACGDSVTGPATLIEAIAQGRLAAHSCDLFLKGEKIVLNSFEFLSKKDNFKKQTSQDYEKYYKKQKRMEMLTLKPDKRKNFDEVELGYSDEDAIKETQRCIECGCSELYYCDLKDYATEYKVNQDRFSGDYKEYMVDFSHPYIEIDNNKCILCGKCIRICSEIVGANALGFVDRGFETYVAPSMDEKLSDTYCESCGMCISACPTGAITENVPFKPAPLKNETFNTICNYCSVGCEITLHHKSSFFNRVTGKEGLINKDGNICRYARFGYRYLNDKYRLTKPMLKKNDLLYQDISYEKAFELIVEKIKKANPAENAFLAGARLTNEEIYMVYKLAQEGVNTSNVGSFHYFNRGEGYRNNSSYNTPFEQLKDAGRIYILGTELNYEHGVIGFDVYNNTFLNGTPVELITTKDNNRMAHKATKVHRIKSYYHFVKAVNHYLVLNKMHDREYTEKCNGFEDYCKLITSENYEKLLNLAGLSKKEIAEFCNNYIKENKAIIIFSEKQLSSNTCLELQNMAMITGKLGKKSSGIISLKEKNNAQGIIDIADCAKLIDNKAKKGDNFETGQDLFDKILNGEIENLFIFGEDPIGCAVSKESVNKILKSPGFVVVQDYFITETALEADLVLPASFPFETGGSFTNAQKCIQQFPAKHQSPLEKTTFEQLQYLQKKLGVKTRIEKQDDAYKEITQILNKMSGNGSNNRTFVYTKKDNYNRMFDHGCDYLVKKFDQEFDEAF